MSIREANLTDSQAIAALLVEMGHLSTPEDVQQRLMALLQSEIDRVWVYEEDGSVVGFLGFHLWPRFYDWGHHGRITVMAIRSDCRRKGYGRRLIEHAEEFARSRDCPRIEVTSYSDRTNAHRFYESAGYTRVKSKRFLKSLGGSLTMRWSERRTAVRSTF